MKMEKNRVARFAVACTMMTALCAYGVVQTGATMTFSGRSFVVKDIGGTERTYAAGESLCPTSIPAVFYIKPVLSAGEHLWGLTGGDKFGGILCYRQPIADGWIPFAPFASAESNMTVSVQLATGVWYVDAENGNDDWDGTADYEHRNEANRIGPKKSLQAAHDAVSGSKSLVYVAPGVYSNGVATVSSGGYTCRRRLYVTKQVGFRSTAGAERTFIVGAPDPATGGLGDNAIAGVHLESGNPHYGPQFLQGFTITGCYTPDRDANYVEKGSALASGANRSWLHDCIISNNFSRQGVAAYGVLSRCRVYDNTSYKYVVGYGGASYSCVFAGNRIRYADSTSVDTAFAYSHPLYGCTIDLRSSLDADGRLRFADSANAYNCLVLGYNGTETACFKSSLALKDTIVADAAAYDFRLGALSPAVAAVAYADMADFARRLASFDVEGRPLAVKDGMATVGAVQNDPPLPCVVISGTGGEAVSGGYSVGTNIVSSGDEVTLTASPSRPFVGFEVNGEMVPYVGTSYTFTPSTVAGSVTSVKAIYSTDWYVDCVNGNDAEGGALGHPKQTIRAAATNAVSGDVIHVAPGTYGAMEGAQPLPWAPNAICARVVVRAGVTVESTAGAKNTFIVGAASPNPSVTEGWQAGVGPGAVRCVAADDGGTLRGFTLTGGYTHASTAEGDENKGGSAFYSRNTCKATIEDCIVSNNVAGRYTIYQAVVRRCRVVGNAAATADVNTSSGAAGVMCAWYSSIIADNKGNDTMLQPSVVENCTLGDGNVWMSNGASAQVLSWWDSKPHSIINSAWMYGRLHISGNLYCTNCLVLETLQDSNVLSHNTIFTNASAMQVDSEYRPVLGSFVGVDSGDVSVSSEALGDTDVYGTPRIMNGAIDMGAVEYDWRPMFAAELGHRFTVIYASPYVTTNATAGLLVPDGAIAGSATSTGPYAIVFSLTGGNLAVYVGGELVGESSGTGEQSIRFIVTNTADEIRFVYTPEAESTVVLKKYVCARGFTISFR